MANPEKLHADTYPNRKSRYESVEEQMAAEAEALDAWFTGLLVWFGSVGSVSWDCAQDLARISEPRNPKRIQHKLVVVLVFEVLWFFTQCTSRREGNRQLTEPKSWTALQAAFPQLNSVPPLDTVANVLEQIRPSEAEAVLTEFCANSEEPTEETQQDSELKAFRRLAKRLKALFLKLRLTIVDDC